MKKFLIIFGTFVLSIISIGTFFKLMHWPGAGPILVIAMTLFSCFYLPLFFIERIIQKTTALNIITNLLGLLSTSSIFMGVLFKTMHWPGAGPMIVLGTTLFVFPTLILYAIQQFKEYDRKFSEFWRTIVLAVLASVFLTFWGLNVSRSVLFAFLKVEDATLETNKNIMEINDYILNDIKQKSSNDPLYINIANTIHLKAVEMTQYIEQLKSDMILTYLQDGPDAVSDHWLITQKDNYDFPTHYLGSAYSEKGVELFTNINQYKTDLKYELQKLPFGNNSEIKQLGDFGINTALREEITQGYKMSWNEGMFSHQTVSATLSLLTGIQNEVLNAEFKSLKMILTNMK